jgi:hypothetical protein
MKEEGRKGESQGGREEQGEEWEQRGRGENMNLL